MPLAATKPDKRIEYIILVPNVDSYLTDQYAPNSVLSEKEFTELFNSLDESQQREIAEIIIQYSEWFIKQPIFEHDSVELQINTLRFQLLSTTIHKIGLISFLTKKLKEAEPHSNR